MGDDFRFQNAHQYFESSDKLIKYFNAHDGKDANIELIYSTPSMYVDAISKNNIVWTTKYDDMFPYADGENAFWTGYFTSRANDKGNFRRASHTLHSSNKLFSLKALDQNVSDEQIKSMVEAKDVMLDVVGVIQHHDGITGTGKQHTANDYVSRVWKGLNKVNPYYAQIIQEIAKNAGFDTDDWEWCSYTNGTYIDCPIGQQVWGESSKVMVAIHNPANLPMKVAQIAVSSTLLSVQKYDASLGKMVDAKANVLCNMEMLDTTPV